jgi:ABC-type dipeptide/oligopeptide/nickel transport system permease component
MAKRYPKLLIHCRTRPYYLFAIIIAIVFGIIFGIISALHKDSWIDRVIALISTLGMSIPFFSVQSCLHGSLDLF